MDLGEETLPQVAGIPHRGPGGVPAAAYAAGQGEEGQDQHQHAVANHLVHLPGGDPPVDDAGRHQGEQDLHHHLQGSEEGGQAGVPLEFL